MQATVRVPGSCGELVQGVLAEDNFLVTCPVSLYATATVRLRHDEMVTGPPGRSKAMAAVRATLEYLGASRGADLVISSQLPPGKGMASSSADVTGACLATALALGRELDLAEIAGLAVRIEPTDGTFLPGISLFDHVAGRRTELLGPAPSLRLLLLDWGGEVDTMSFNAREDLQALNLAKADHVARAVGLVRRGIRTGNLQMVGEGASLSAHAHQELLPKPMLAEVESFARQRGALGINVAHSGTVAGLLLPPGLAPDRLRYELESEFEQVAVLAVLDLVDGGLEVLEIDGQRARGAGPWRRPGGRGAPVWVGRGGVS